MGVLTHLISGAPELIILQAILHEFVLSIKSNVLTIVRVSIRLRAECLI